MDSLKIGTTLHGKKYNYRIVRLLGHGAFGITYLASISLTGDLGTLDSEIFVAIKAFHMLPRDRENESYVTGAGMGVKPEFYKSIFVNEAYTLSKLRHPGVVKVMELFEENSSTYYVMEYISGGTLEGFIKKRGRLSAAECINYTLKIADTLSYLHLCRTLHLDLKPSNIMIGKSDRLVLIDFSSSRRFDTCNRPDTSSPMGVGTPGYSPIEQTSFQSANNGEFPSFMDVYALGATMYNMLTGQRPPEAWEILNDGFPLSHLEMAGVATPLALIVAKCMEPRFKDRYQNVSDVIQALSKLTADLKPEDKYWAPNGFFKKEMFEQGTAEFVNMPVASTFDFPKTICVRLWDNTKKGKSFEVIMSDAPLSDGYYSRLKIWDKGLMIDERGFETGITEDVRQFIISHGFLSTEHWEREYSTTMIADNFGIDASILMILPDGRRFGRIVKNAHPDFHHLLLDELYNLLLSTSLLTQTGELHFSHPSSSTIDNILSDPPYGNIPLRKDTDMIIISHSTQSPATIGYELIITSENLKLRSTGMFRMISDRMSGSITGRYYIDKKIDCQVFNQIANEIRGWKYIPDGPEFNQGDYSETPDRILILLYENPNHPYLTLNCESIAGNNYGNIYGDSYDLNMKIKSLIPDFDNLLAQSENLYNL